MSCNLPYSQFADLAELPIGRFGRIANRQITQSLTQKETASQNALR